MKRSLRLRLLLILVALFSLVWVLVTTASYYAAQHEIEELFDAQLAQYARTLQALTQHELEEDEHEQIQLDNSFLGHTYEKKVMFQVWNGPTLVLHSGTAPDRPMSDLFGFTDRDIDGATWRVFALPGAKEAAAIQVAERYDVREELVNKISLQVLYPLIIALPLLAIVLWFAVGGGLRPLRALTREVGARSPHELQPLPDNAAPKELAPLVAAINGLLAQLRRALESERRFTADAAHELRTPLAALKMQAQVAQGAVQREERMTAIDNIVTNVDRGTRLVEQLLTLARLDPEVTQKETEAVDLAALAAQVVGEYAPDAIRKGVDLGLEEGSRGQIRGLPEAVRVMLRNLVDNAVKYTPAGGRVDVGVSESHQGVIVSVADSGPGIDPELRERVFNRFYRVVGNEEEGSGLGLSIVQRIAELHQAQVAFDAEYGPGLKVVVRFQSQEP
ncbi:MAG: two-component sensor histidine kinase [Proteobacteria bacterium]|nr:MAG: two-component sensor histidine kinase [Pseudomonadota bacterium]QKK10854.1 MAG: two-component sensor histidine kinase [Pseudomonadota bacterium]